MCVCVCACVCVCLCLFVCVCVCGAVHIHCIYRARDSGSEPRKLYAVANPKQFPSALRNDEGNSKKQFREEEHIGSGLEGS